MNEIEREMLIKEIRKVRVFVLIASLIGMIGTFICGYMIGSLK